MAVSGRVQQANSQPDAAASLCAATGRGHARQHSAGRHGVGGGGGGCRARLPTSTLPLHMRLRGGYIRRWASSVISQVIRHLSLWSPSSEMASNETLIDGAKAKEAGVPPADAKPAPKPRAVTTVGKGGEEIDHNEKIPDGRVELQGAYMRSLPVFPPSLTPSLYRG